MKKQFIISALALITCASPYSFAQNNIEPVAKYIEYNKLKYGADQVAVGTINARVTEKIKAKPDTVEFSIKYLTEGSTPNEASNKNTTNMKILTNYLEQLGIKQNDLTTISYRNYEQLTPKPIAKTQDKLFETTITVNLPITTEEFAEVIALLEKYNISNIERSQPTDTYYSFTISEKATDAKTAKQLAQNKYKTLSEQLKTKGINKVIIEKYLNQQIELTKEKVKTYFVENTLQIRTHNFNNLGKVIAKAQELGMNVNNDISYSISDEARNKLIEQSQSQLLAKLIQKAKTLLGNNNYQLGAVQNLESFEDQSIIQPRNYAYNKMSINRMEQAAVADSIEIQTPTDFDINITLTGSFDIIKPVHRP